MKLQAFLFLLILSAGFFSCDSDDPEPENPEELITTLRMTWVPTGGGQNVVFQFQDLDGDGGNAPVIQTAPLAAQTTYSVNIEVLDESVSPAEDITEEILAEDEDHQFFFSASNVILTFAYSDQDGDGNPIGLSTAFGTGLADTGTFTVTLRHHPDKNATGVAIGDITNAGGETDLEVTFPMTIQ